MSFGATLRLIRLQSGLGLRDLARRLGVSSAYLSRVESGVDPAPTPQRLVTMARELGVPAPTLIAIARRVSPLLTDYMERVPEASSVFTDIVLRNLDSEQLKQVQAFVESRFPLRVKAQRGLHSIRALLSEDRVIVGLHCSRLTDALEIAAGRLGADCAYDVTALSAALTARERDVPSGIGSGVAVVGVYLEDVPEAAALVTFASPVKHATPDNHPLRLLVVLVGPRGNSSLGPYVAEVASWVEAGLAERLSNVEAPRCALAALDRFAWHG